MTELENEEINTVFHALYKQELKQFSLEFFYFMMTWNMLMDHLLE